MSRVADPTSGNIPPDWRDGFDGCSRSHPLQIFPEDAAVLGRSILAACTLVFAWAAVALSAEPLVVTPAEVQLEGNFARAQLVVSRPNGEGQLDMRSEDLTSRAAYASSDPAVVRVSPSGQLLAVADGQAKVTVTVNDAQCEVAVTVSKVAAQPTIHFTRDIRPILTKSGCAMAACHAAQHGKGGFKLSVFGFEPEKDRDAMVRDAQARRGGSY